VRLPGLEPDRARCSPPSFIYGGDAVTAFGSSNDAITLGNGDADTVNAVSYGGGNNTITLGNGAGDAVHGSYGRNDTIFSATATRTR
jgi:hypothetical protein